MTDQPLEAVCVNRISMRQAIHMESARIAPQTSEPIEAAKAYIAATEQVRD